MRINEFNESRQTCPECGGPSFTSLVLAEKQDACYAKVKSRYKVWPSAYASGALVQCRKKGAANWGNKSEGVAEGSEQQWVVTVGTKTGGTSHTMTFSGTKEQAIKKALARFGTSKNPVVTAKPKEQGVAEGSMYGDEEVSWEQGGRRAPTGAFRNPNAEEMILDPDTYELIDEYIAKIEPDADREEIARSIMSGHIHTSELEYALQDEDLNEEGYNPEYDDEAGMADNNLETLRRAVDGLDDLIDTGDNLPEWCQEKIAVAKSMLVSVWDYMESKDDSEEEFDLIESIVDRIAAQNGVDPEMVWEDLESLTEDELYAFAVTSQLNEDWSKANKSDRTDGMSQKAVKAYRREHPGSKLQTAVTTKPSKLKKGSKASKRRKSYCSRSKGQMNMHNISCAKTPDKAICKARRRWNC